MQLSKN